MISPSPSTPSVSSAPRRVRVVSPPRLAPLAMLGGLAELWHYRDLLYTQTLHRIRVRYKQSALGLAWAFLQPVSLMLVYTMIFSAIARMPSDGVPYSLFSFLGLLPWLFFSSSMTAGAASLVGHSHLITKVYFPREILPLSYVFAALFDFVVGSAFLAVLFVYHGVWPSTTAWMVIFPLMAAFVFTTGLVLLLSAVQVRIRDIGIAMPLLIQLGMFATPVVYPLSAVPSWLQPYYLWNPMASVVENVRRSTLGSPPFDWYSFVTGAAISVVVLVVGYVYFKYTEATMADYV